MTDTYRSDYDQQSTRGRTQHSVFNELDASASAAAETTATYHSSLLGGRSSGGRGSDHLRATTMQQAQQIHGNRAVQRFLQSTSLAGTHNELASRIERASTGGSKLDPGTRGKLEEGLDADLSDVRVHTDAEADRLAKSVDATAFTTGKDIFFRSGAYNPHSPDGLRLLAHETTHTLQQAAGPVAGTAGPGGISLSDPSDSFEQAAEATGARIAEGKSASETLTGATNSPSFSAGADNTPVQRGGIGSGGGSMGGGGGGGGGGLFDEITKRAGGLLGGLGSALNTGLGAIRSPMIDMGLDGGPLAGLAEAGLRATSPLMDLTEGLAGVGRGGEAGGGDLLGSLGSIVGDVANRVGAGVGDLLGGGGGAGAEGAGADIPPEYAGVLKELFERIDGTSGGSVDPGHYEQPDPADLGKPPVDPGHDGPIDPTGLGGPIVDPGFYGNNDSALGGGGGGMLEDESAGNMW